MTAKSTTDFEKKKPDGGISDDETHQEERNRDCFGIKNNTRN